MQSLSTNAGRRRPLLEGDRTEGRAVGEGDRFQVEVHPGRDFAAAGDADSIRQFGGQDLELGKKTGQDLRDERSAPGADSRDVAVTDDCRLSIEGAVGIRVRRLAGEGLVTFRPYLYRVFSHTDAESWPHPVKVEE